MSQGIHLFLEILHGQRQSSEFSKKEDELNLVVVTRTFQQVVLDTP